MSQFELMSLLDNHSMKQLHTRSIENQSILKIKIHKKEEGQMILRWQMIQKEIFFLLKKIKTVRTPNVVQTSNIIKMP